MIHIGTVHLNGREYSLELNHTGEPRSDSAGQLASATARKNLPAARSDVVPLNAARRFPAQNFYRPSSHGRSIAELRRVVLSDRKERARTNPTEATRKDDPEHVVKLVSRFLSWCFPVREFNSPLQRILYLSIEGPKSKYRRRFLLP